MLSSLLSCYQTQPKYSQTAVLTSGHGVLAMWESKAGLALGLALVSIGAGGIKPCVSALVGDQFDQVRSSLSASTLLRSF